MSDNARRPGPTKEQLRELKTLRANELAREKMRPPMSEYKPIGIKVILEYEMTDLWLDRESIEEEADFWTDERLIDLIHEDVGVAVEEGTWRVEREEATDE